MAREEYSVGRGGGKNSLDQLNTFLTNSKTNTQQQALYLPLSPHGLVSPQSRDIEAADHEGLWQGQNAARRGVMQHPAGHGAMAPSVCFELVRKIIELVRNGGVTFFFQGCIQEEEMPLHTHIGGFAHVKTIKQNKTKNLSFDQPINFWTNWEEKKHWGAPSRSGIPDETLETALR